MNIELLELAESAQGELVDQVVFVGGATVELWITDRPLRLSALPSTSTSWSRSRRGGGSTTSRPSSAKPASVKAKLEAFKGRGNGDFLASRDSADWIT